MGYYANQCSEKKKGKAKHVAARTVAGVEEDSSQFETTFSIVSCLSSNTM